MATKEKNKLGGLILVCLARLLLGEVLHGRNSLWAKPAASETDA